MSTFRNRHEEINSHLDTLRKAAAKRSRKEGIPVPLENHLHTAACTIWAQGLSFIGLQTALLKLASQRRRETGITEAITTEAIKRLKAAELKKRSFTTHHNQPKQQSLNA